MAKKIDLSRLKTVSIRQRKSKTSIADFSRPGRIPGGTRSCLKGLIPAINFGKQFKELAELVIRARKKRKPIIFMFGAHVIKCGLAPILIDLMRRKYITFLATNGAALIHDFEIAYCGNTSEFVEQGLSSGNFGITRETAGFVNEIAKEAARTDRGAGETAGRKINSQKLKYRGSSVFAMAHELGVPITVHVAIGTDVVHQHESCDAASWGKASYADFLKLCEGISGLGNGGVVLNFGSAVIMPEIFLKAINICRNLGHDVDNFTAANFDMIRHYRPMTNIVQRPTSKYGHGFNFVGYHELMLPLLYLELVSK
jgi:hypothetical protein